MRPQRPTIRATTHQVPLNDTDGVACQFCHQRTDLVLITFETVGMTNLALVCCIRCREGLGYRLCPSYLHDIEQYARLKWYRITGSLPGDMRWCAFAVMARDADEVEAVVRREFDVPAGMTFGIPVGMPGTAQRIDGSITVLPKEK